MHVKHLLPLLVTAVVGGQDTTVGTNCDSVWNGSVSPSLVEQHKNLFENLSPTLTTMVDKWGGVQFCDSKSLTTIEAKCGGGWSRVLKTVTHDGV